MRTRDLIYPLTTAFICKKKTGIRRPGESISGPFMHIIIFSRENHWDINTQSTTTSVDTKTVMNMHSVGFQLGYQFIFWNRVSLDLILVGAGHVVFQYQYRRKYLFVSRNEELLFRYAE